MAKRQKFCYSCLALESNLCLWRTQAKNYPYDLEFFSKNNECIWRSCAHLVASALEMGCGGWTLPRERRRRQDTRWPPLCVPSFSLCFCPTLGLSLPLSCLILSPPRKTASLLPAAWGEENGLNSASHHGDGCLIWDECYITHCSESLWSTTICFFYPHGEHALALRRPPCLLVLLMLSEIIYLRKQMDILFNVKIMTIWLAW